MSQFFVVYGPAEFELREILGPKPRFKRLRSLLGADVPERIRTRYISFVMGRMGTGREYAEKKTYVLPVDGLAEALGRLHLRSRDMGTLAQQAEQVCRREDAGFESWQWAVVRELRKHEKDLLFEEVCRANPGRAVCVSECGIEIG